MHARASTRFLTGVPPKPTDGADFQAGISIDQIAARELGQQTQLRVARAEPRIDRVRRAPATRATAAPTPTRICLAQRRPRRCRWRTTRARVFERLFGDSGSTDPAARLARAAAAAQHPRLGDRQGRAASGAAWGRRSRQARPSTSTRCATSSARIQKAEAAERPASCRVVEQPAGIPAHVRGARQADVRPAGAGLPVRPDPRHHVHDGHASSAAGTYPRNRRARRASPDLAPSETTPEKLAKLLKINTYHTDAVRLLTSRSCRRRPTATARCSITSR